jgi:hypothetical protein
MLTLLLAAGAIALAPQTFDLSPTDDVWVYPHASDPEKDPFLRAWGSGGKSVSATPDEAGEFSYSYLKWDLSTLPKTGSKLTEARLTVWLVADPGYTEQYAKENPLEVRPVKPEFAEKGWNFDIAAKVIPTADAKGVFGSAYPKGYKKDGKEIALAIDLLKGPGDLRKHLAELLMTSNPKLGLALTASMDPSDAGRTAVYKLYSKDAERKEVRPVLHLVFAPGS